eukprot:m.230111 g.230111  ORF g.230111 m.230111 type:complete len:672 (-) comp19253_c0_seq1:122-2137(-)
MHLLASTLCLCAFIAGSLAQIQRSEFCAIGRAWDATSQACSPVGTQIPARSVSNPVVYPHDGSLVTAVPVGGSVIFKQTNGSSVDVLNEMTLQRQLVAGLRTDLGSAQNLSTQLQGAIAAVVANQTVEFAGISGMLDTLANRTNHAIGNIESLVADNVATLRQHQASLNSMQIRKANDTDFQHLLQAMLPQQPPVFAYEMDFDAMHLTETPIESSVEYRIRVRIANATELAAGTWHEHVFDQGDGIFVVDGLTQLTNYTAQIRGESRVGNGEWGVMFNVTTTKRPPMGEDFHCTRGWASTCSGGRVCNICSVVVQLPWPAILYAGVTGHTRVSSGWIYTSISFNNDDANPGANRMHAPAHSYSTQWENHHTARVSSTMTGNVTVTVNIRCSNNCNLNGFGMNGFFVRDEGAMTISNKCQFGGWSMPFSNNRALCNMPYTVNETSLVTATFTGHQRVTGGAVYMIVNYDNDALSRTSTQMYLPAHSYSNQWESFGSHRTKLVNNGTHFTQAISNAAAGWFNGAGLSHLVFPAESRYAASQQFHCTPSGWGVGCGGNTCLVCETSISLPFDAVVLAEFTGHYSTNGGWCYGAVGFDNDAMDTLRTTPSGWQRLGLAHGYSTRWENFNTHRTAKLPAGEHTVQLAIRANSACWLNGVGMDGMWFRAATPADALI